jgi:hypothetical protein
MKLTKNEDVLSENDENNRACIHANKEGEHGHRDVFKWQFTIKSVCNANIIQKC